MSHVRAKTKISSYVYIPPYPEDYSIIKWHGFTNQYSIPNNYKFVICMIQISNIYYSLSMSNVPNDY